MSSSKRAIGLRSAAALVAANMIGAGVFTTSGFALSDLGRPEFVLLAWGVGAVVALCGALSYAGIAAAFPENGGEYHLLSEMAHPLLGFLAGWVSIFAGFTAPIAVAAHGLEAYAAAAIGTTLPGGVLGAGSIVLCGALHASSRGSGLGTQDLAVGLKLLAIAAFVVLGGAAILFGESGEGTVAAVAGAADEAARVRPFDLGAFAVTLVWISFAFAGWNAAIYVAGEIDRPSFTLPRALAIATAAVGLVYFAMNAVFVYAAPVTRLAGRPDIGAAAAEALGGAAAQAALSGVVALALLTSVSAMIMVGSRVYAKMAEDGVLPRFLASEGSEPRAAIAVQVGLSLLAFSVAGLRELLDYVGFLLGLSTAATVCCLFLPTWRARLAPKVVGYPFVPLVFVAVTLGSSAFMIQREPRESALGAVTLVAGAIVYRFLPVARDGAGSR